MEDKYGKKNKNKFISSGLPTKKAVIIECNILYQPASPAGPPSAKSVLRILVQFSGLASTQRVIVKAVTKRSYFLTGPILAAKSYEPLFHRKSSKRSINFVYLLQHVYLLSVIYDARSNITNFFSTDVFGGSVSLPFSRTEKYTGSKGRTKRPASVVMVC